MMEFKHNLLVILIPLFAKVGYLQKQCINANKLTFHQIGLRDSQFWTSKAQDIEQCAKLCIRLKPCKSITFDTKSGMCKLNSGTRQDTSTRAGASLGYSELKWWPTTLDKECYAANCKNFETCIPGTLLDKSSGECSYSCIPVNRGVCPLPPWGVTNGRSVGSVNTYTCGKGTTGGGTATCLPDNKWSKDITPSCRNILQHECDDNSLCSQINGKCDNGRCVCGQYKTYNSTDKECNLACGDPNMVEGATVNGSGQVRQYVCKNADRFSSLYPEPGTGNGTINCDIDTLSWKPEGFRCRGVRLTNVLENIGSTSGFLKILEKGKWRLVTHEKWSRKATMVAYKSLGFRFGGTFHKNWLGQRNPDRLPDAYNLENIGCTGEEEKLEQCSNFNTKDGETRNDIALTCFHYNISASSDVYLLPGADNGAVVVNISGVIGGVCGSSWDAPETNVACRTIDPTWKRYGECKSCGATTVAPFQADNFKCEGDEPHLFYCRNKGWGYDNGCIYSKTAKITCGP